MSIDQSMKARIVELGRALADRKAIYLDVRYWIILRQAALADDDSSPYGELLQRLRNALNSGKVFCPISETVFLELLKQSDPASRLRTARMIDELSLGVSLLSHHERVATELAHFFHTHREGAELHPLRHLVWIKLPYVLGRIYPQSGFDRRTELAVQKAVLDHMWTLNLEQMVDAIGNAPVPFNINLEDIADKLNVGNAAHAGEIRSYNQAWIDELSGVADLCADIAAEIMAEIAESHGHAAPPRESEGWKQTRTMCANLLFHGLQAKPGLRHKIPTLYIEACLHATIRWDKTYRLDGNDLHDFHHASAAMGYCQAFFTERPLKTLLALKHHGLADDFSCRVASDATQTLDILYELDK